jgi:hypothetical protein
MNTYKMLYCPLLRKTRGNKGYISSIHANFTFLLHLFAVFIARYSQTLKKWLVEKQSMPLK